MAAKPAGALTDEAVYGSSIPALAPVVVRVSLVVSLARVAVVAAALAISVAAIPLTVPIAAVAAISASVPLSHGLRVAAGSASIAILVGWPGAAEPGSPSTGPGRRTAWTGTESTIRLETDASACRTVAAAVPETASIAAVPTTITAIATAVEAASPTSKATSTSSRKATTEAAPTKALTRPVRPKGTVASSRAHHGTLGIASTSQSAAKTSCAPVFDSAPALDINEDASSLEHDIVCLLVRG